jgi:hypothetical protein
MGNFGCAKQILDKVLDRLSPSSSHFQVSSQLAARHTAQPGIIFACMELQPARSTVLSRSNMVLDLLDAS